jgi:hypothetical protein
MNVLMVSMTIAMTQTMRNQSSEDVWPPFQSNDCTHDPRWLNYVFTIEHTFEWIKNWHMSVIKIPNHQLACVCFLNFSSFERSHLDSIKFGPHI